MSLLNSVDDVDDVDGVGIMGTWAREWLGLRVSSRFIKNFGVGDVGDLVLKNFGVTGVGP